MPARPTIGVSACFFHPDPERNIFKGKTLLYLEQSMAHWIMREGGNPVLVPTAPDGVSVREQVAGLDGLLLHGGDDVAPESYGERPLRPEWCGDRVRDEYDIALVQECIDARIPVLGICRGIQILNVALGGSLHQDIAEQVPGALPHRDRDLYDQLYHDVALEPASHLARVFGVERGRVNSVHHQSIAELGAGFVVEARCPDDGIIEGARLESGDTYAVGIQWHPEFQTAGDEASLDQAAIFADFVGAIGARAGM